MASNLLWAHLLRKDATTTDSNATSQIPPIAPQDKTGTSMRMLIHDTQVNLEKFSARLDGLLQRVEDCRVQVVNANKLLDVERDKVLSEILEIAHRCQSEMKTHVGTPAQASALELVQVSLVSTERSVQALEKRIDALQTLLQTQAHAMQSIQDQQNTLVGAVLPLVPMFQGVSPQMDQIKTTLSEIVANAVSTMTNNMDNLRSTLVTEPIRGHGCARSSTRVESSSKSTLSSRRKRSDPSALGPDEIKVPVSSPLDSRGSRPSLKRPRIEGATHHTEIHQFPRKLSRLIIPPTDSGGPPVLLQTPRTPRKPLADLLLVPGSEISKVQRHMANRTNSTSDGYMRHCETLRGTSGTSTNAAPMLQSHSLQESTITRRRSARSRDIPLAVELPITAGPSNWEAMSKAIKIEEILEADFTGVISINSSPLSSPPSSAPRHDPLETGDHSNMTGGPQVEPSPNPDISPPKSMSLRDRRAQMSKFGRTETRRFIPLVPWSDDEE